MSFHGGVLGRAARHLPVLPQPQAEPAGGRRSDLPRRCPSACSSGASPISSTANCGERSPTCPGRWCFPTRTPPGVPRHPSQIYEALMEGALLFFILRVLIVRGIRSHRRPGVISASFLAGYGVVPFHRRVLPRFRIQDLRLVQHGPASQSADVGGGGILVLVGADASGGSAADAGKARGVSPLKREAPSILSAPTGRSSIGDYMRLALYDPEHGYYMRRDPFGVGGDFITAPEMSQLFGELIGVVPRCRRGRIAGSPDPLPPGRTRAGARHADGRYAARGARPAGVSRGGAKSRLVETSPALRAVQAKTLAGSAVDGRGARSRCPTTRRCSWSPTNFSMRCPSVNSSCATGGWHERMVAADGEGLAFALAPDAAPLAFPPGADGAILRDVARSLAIVARRWPAHRARGRRRADRRLRPSGAGFGDTFQAVKAHTAMPIRSASPAKPI